MIFHPAFIKITNVDSIRSRLYMGFESGLFCYYPAEDKCLFDSTCPDNVSYCPGTDYYDAKCRSWYKLQIKNPTSKSLFFINAVASTFGDGYRFAG
jgi:hypothetical protein